MILLHSLSCSCTLDSKYYFQSCIFFSFMMITNSSLNGSMQEKMIIHIQVILIYYLEYYSISTEQQHILQPYLLLNFLGHNNYIPRMWPALMWTTPLSISSRKEGRAEPLTQRMSIPHLARLTTMQEHGVILSIRIMRGHWRHDLVAFAEQHSWGPSEKMGVAPLDDWLSCSTECGGSPGPNGSGCTVDNAYCSPCSHWLA